MKKILMLVAIACITKVSAAQDKSEREPYLVKSLANESIKNVEVQTSGGSITVEGETPDKARVEVYVWPSNSKKSSSWSKEDIRKKLESDYDLKISVSNGKLTATAKSKEKIRDWNDALSISFKVYAPKSVSTQLSTSGGSIHLEDLAGGTQDFTTSGGSLHIDKVKGKITGRTSGGSIHLSDSEQDIDLTTSGGSIHADRCSGKIQLSTSGGSVELNNLSGNIDASTSGGSVRGDEISGELSAHTSGGNVNLKDLRCSLETSTSGGNINVSIVEPGKYVRISNSGGNIDLEIPGNKGLDLKLSGSKIKTDKLGNFSGSLEEDEINGKLNGGGIPVTVKAGSGRIYLSVK